MDTPTVTVSTTSPKEGEQVSFTCNVVTTFTIDRYAWYHNDQEVSAQSGKEFLLNGGTRKDSGSYSCKVITIEGTEKISTAQNIEYLCK